MNIKQICENGSKIVTNTAKVMVGKEETVRLLLTALLAGGNVLLEDIPGTGKTKLAKTLAASLDADFSRIQFTPDLLPSDVTGLNIYNRKENEFVLRKGPVFTNILLADEINRATPRTQAGLLECMEERQVTIDGVRHELQRPFFVMATQNPVETAGTYPLPEAQLDRFMMKLSLGLPEREEELLILERFMDIDEQRDPLGKLEAVINRADILDMQKSTDQVFVHPLIRGYIADIVAATREGEAIIMGASPRASLALLRGAKVWAALHGREYCIPDDAKRLAVPVLAHRVMLAYGYRKGSDARDVIGNILKTVQAPTEDVKQKVK